MAGPQFRCTPPTPVDLIFLVDGSWSIGHSHFRQVKDFLASIIKPFEIGPDKVQVGLTQYSGDPQTEWDLNTFHTKEEVLAAVHSLRYKGGNTFTGLALTHVLRQSLRPAAGPRPEAAKVVILVTDGKSQDDAHAAGRVLKDLDVDVFAVGVKNADEAELRLLASQPLDVTVHSVPDFPQLGMLAGLLSRLICQKVQGRSQRRGPVSPAAAAPALDPLSAPTSLVLTQVTFSSVRLSWTPAPQLPLKYLVTWRPSRGGAPREVVVEGPSASAELHNLTSSTEYLVSVAPVYEAGVGEGLRGLVTTGPLPPPQGLTLATVTPRTIRLTWQPSAGATQYLVRCSPASPKGEEDGMEVRVGLPEVLLDGLEPGRDYSVWVRSLRGSEASEARGIRAKTRECPPRRPPPTRGGAVTAVPKPSMGRRLQTPPSGPISPSCMFGKAGRLDPEALLCSAGPPGPPKHLGFSDVSHDSARVFWEGTPRPVRPCRVSYVSGEGGHSGQTEAPGNATSAILGPLASSTTYTVHVTCLHPGGRSSRMTGRLTTRKVPSPSQLSVTELPGDKVRLEWAAAAASGVLVYQIKWLPLGDGKAHEISVPGNLGTAVLPGLGRHSEYEITILAYYGDGARSEPVSLRYTPLRWSPPSGLALDSESPNSLRVSWTPPSGHVLYYRVTYVLASGSGPEKSVSIPGPRSQATLLDLLAATKYRVLVSAVYEAGESVAVSATGRTAACPALHPNSSVAGFDLMAAFGLAQKEYASIRGVAMEPSALGPAMTFTLFKDAQLTRRARPRWPHLPHSDIHLAALPTEHTVVFLLRLLPETPREAFALWQMTAEDFQPVLGVLLDASRRSLTYFSHHPRAALQEVTFDLPEVHVAVGHSKVRLYVDCQKVAERPIGEAGSPPATGFVTLGRLAKARGPRSSSAALQLQMLQIVCSDTWAEEDRCCELPALMDGEACPTPPSACTCPPQAPGPPGPQGPPGLPGPKGERGEKVSVQCRGPGTSRGHRAGTSPHTYRYRLVTVLGHVACLPLQGEPQSLATIYQLVSQACESAIQIYLLKSSPFPHVSTRPPRPILEAPAPPSMHSEAGLPRSEDRGTGLGGVWGWSLCVAHSNPCISPLGAGWGDRVPQRLVAADLEAAGFLGSSEQPPFLPTPVSPSHLPSRPLLCAWSAQEALSSDLATSVHLAVLPRRMERTDGGSGRPRPLGAALRLRLWNAHADGYPSWAPRNPMEPHGTPQSLTEPHGAPQNPTEPHRTPQSLAEPHGAPWNPTLVPRVEGPRAGDGELSGDPRKAGWWEDSGLVVQSRAPAWRGEQACRPPAPRANPECVREHHLEPHVRPLPAALTTAITGVN
ncbi:Collagen alpha-1(XX) chain [Pteropus alecto]|uniref:Collagen alpha-1(XX) chain n=1 Tax=Pteropus alecto TaxID=9402 RepID=L5JY92_PTEAL|nr:Collagen alpha-1(XX) chain [Pteropus alecto]